MPLDDVGEAACRYYKGLAVLRLDLPPETLDHPVHHRRVAEDETGLERGDGIFADDAGRGFEVYTG